jgi:aquaporin Z
MSNSIAKPAAAKIPPPPDRATSVSVNPARSLGLALLMGGAALGQLWLFIVAPLKGAGRISNMRSMADYRPRLKRRLRAAFVLSAIRRSRSK